MRAMKWVLVGLLAAGCGGKSANCEFAVNDATICMDGMSMSYCEKEYGGIAHEADSTDDPTCEDLGYPVECTGYSFEEVGENFSATYNNFYAATEDDCAAADGGVLDHTR